MEREKFRTNKRERKRQRVRTIVAKFNMEKIQVTSLSNDTVARKQNDKDPWKCTQMKVIHIAYSGIILPMR